MNEMSRRLLDAVQNSQWLASVVRKDGKLIGMDFYNYNTSLIGLLAAATGLATIQIQSDSDFALAYMSGSVVSTGAVVANPLATLQITDTGTGKTFFSAPTLFGLVMGNGGLPFYLPAPRVVTPNTNINFALTNLSGVTQDCYINLLGARLYYAS